MIDQCKPVCQCEKRKMFGAEVEHYFGPDIWSHKAAWKQGAYWVDTVSESLLNSSWLLPIVHHVENNCKGNLTYFKAKCVGCFFYLNFNYKEEMVWNILWLLLMIIMILFIYLACLKPNTSKKYCNHNQANKPKFKWWKKEAEKRPVRPSSMGALFSPYSC